MSSRKIIVAICGAKGHGKDCIAEQLSRAFGFTHEKVASPLKSVCVQLFGFDDEQVHGGLRDVVDDRWGVSPRRVLQFVGTEMFQFQLQQLLPHVGRAFWAKSLVSRIARSGAERVVVSDMRFPHELSALRELESRDYRIVALRIERAGAPEDDAHPSETEFRDIRPVHVVRNDGDLVALQRQVDELVSDGLLDV